MARRSLMNAGLITCAGALGNKRLFFEPTRGEDGRGERWAEAHGIELPKLHGGVLHSFCISRSEQRIATAWPGAKFVHRRTGEPAGVRPDSLIQLPGADGRLIALQVALGHEPKGEVANLLKLLGISNGDASNEQPSWGGGPVGLVICIAGSRRIMKAVETGVKRENAGQLPVNLVLIDGEESLFSPDFSWGDVLQREA